MRGALRFSLLLTILIALSPLSRAGQPVVSTMRNVNAVMQARGYFINPAPDYSGREYPGDLAPTQAFEIIRPRGEKIRIGRLYTSCSCVRLETSKTTFEQGERAIFELRNVIATPHQGQRYAIYIQITSPIRTTLRYDTFVQSSQFIPQPIIEIVEPEPVVSEPEPVVEEKAETEDKVEAVEEAVTEEAAPETEKTEKETGDKTEEAIEDATDESVVEAAEAIVADEGDKEAEPAAGDMDNENEEAEKTE